MALELAIAKIPIESIIENTKIAPSSVNLSLKLCTHELIALWTIIGILSGLATVALPVLGAYLKKKKKKSIKLSKKNQRQKQSVEQVTSVEFQSIEDKPNLVDLSNILTVDNTSN
jgi:hypothetical protein